jgi:hypothetical protein
VFEKQNLQKYFSNVHNIIPTKDEKMNTPPPQTLRADMSPSTRGNDRRQQTDRRRVSGRRETDQEQPEESFQRDGDNDAHRRKTILNSRPAGRAISDDEIRFLLDDD